MKALVTGGSAGLGAAIVDELLGEGAQVVTVDLKPRESHDNLVQFECDLSDRNAVDGVLAAILSAGPFDLVILNAGVNATGSFEELPVETHLRLLRVNIETPMLMASALAGGQAMAQGSCMVLVSSLSHFTGYPGAASYAASKDALAIYAKSIRKPFAELEIGVATVFPGPLRTDHASRHAPVDADAAKRMPPEKAAAEILAAVRAGKHTIFPGRQAQQIALAGRIAPKLVTWQMRKLIYERLKGPVW